ncbi:RB-associated KRAB zinc finger protein-like [Ochlerotatus camptorhynchus]|uniref:RB-associated KRAB zinc finger protein-like n=1 Tax=Ochlerotatus camptorhynchus TaxID=644619 RepID=UPI0031D22787
MAKCIKIEVPDPPTDEPESYCRFCYSKGKDLVSIFPATGIPLQCIINLLKKLTGIILNVTEDLPSAICSQCLSKLEEFDHFRRKCNIYNDKIKRIRFQWKDCPSVYIKNEQIPEQVEDIVPGNETICDKQVVKLDEKPPTFESYPASVANGSLNDKIKRFSLSKTGRTGPLMEKLNKLRGIKSKKQKRTLEQKDYRCRVCLQFFTDKESINFHMRNHIDTVNLRCLNCSKIFGKPQGLIAHTRTTYIQTAFSCQHCDVLFKSKETLFAHELYCEQDQSKYDISETPKPCQCALCPKSFDTMCFLQSHMLLHEAKFACVKCGVDLPSAVLLKNHNERYHSKGADQIATVVKCEPCQRTFVDASAYRSHHTRFHQFNHGKISRKLDEDKLYECDHCGKRFWSINTIRYHVLVHRQYRDCDQCSESFRSLQELHDHKLATHPVKCEFCHMNFFSKRACRSHSNVKHGMLQVKMLAEGEKKVVYEWRKLVFKCASCEQDYEKYRELKDHYGKMHPGANIQIKCSYCAKNSTSRIGYVGHMTGNCGQTPKKVKAWH